MTMFHINSKGVPAICKAKKGNCPFGGQSGTDNHFSTLEEAQEKADATHEEEFGLLSINTNGETSYSIDDFIEDEEKTDNVNESIFIMENGVMISGQYDMGMRGIDHNCIIGVAPDDIENHADKWDYIHHKHNVVRIVNETGVALIGKNQELNEDQLSLLEDYNIQRY